MTDIGRENGFMIGLNMGVPLDLLDKINDSDFGEGLYRVRLLEAIFDNNQLVTAKLLVQELVDEGAEVSAGELEKKFGLPSSLVPEPGELTAVDRPKLLEACQDVDDVFFFGLMCLDIEYEDLETCKSDAGRDFMTFLRKVIAKGVSRQQRERRRQSGDPVLTADSLAKLMDRWVGEIDADKVRRAFGVPVPEASSQSEGGKVYPAYGNRPVAKQLVQELKVLASIWSTLALQLGFSQGAIDCCGVNSSYKCDSALENILKEYMKRRTACWEEICDACKSVEGATLAEKLRQNYCQ